jgi:hypothetical protein
MKNQKGSAVQANSVIQTLEGILIKACYQKELPIIKALYDKNLGQIGETISFGFPIKSKPRVRFMRVI